MTVIDEIAAERHRQINSEGFTAEHDDRNYKGPVMVSAALCYAYSAIGIPSGIGQFIEAHWPWPRQWWKPKDARRDLLRAAALLVAEIERMDRANG